MPRVELVVLLSFSIAHALRTTFERKLVDMSCTEAVSWHVAPSSVVGCSLQCKKDPTCLAFSHYGSTDKCKLCNTQLIEAETADLPVQTFLREVAWIHDEANGRAYYLDLLPRSWSDARQSCRLVGGDLAFYRS